MLQTPRILCDVPAACRASLDTRGRFCVRRKERKKKKFSVGRTGMLFFFLANIRLEGPLLLAGISRWTRLRISESPGPHTAKFTVNEGKRMFLGRVLCRKVRERLKGGPDYLFLFFFFFFFSVRALWSPHILFRWPRTEILKSARHARAGHRPSSRCARPAQPCRQKTNQTEADRCLRVAHGLFY